MPKFNQQPIEAKKSVQKGIPQEVIEQYKPFVEQLEKGNEGFLEFGPDEKMATGRKALQEAGVQLKKYLKVQKVRGEDNRLKFRQITKKEYDEAKKRAEARGAKLRGPRRPKG